MSIARRILAAAAAALARKLDAPNPGTALALRSTAALAPIADRQFEEEEGFLPTVRSTRTLYAPPPSAPQIFYAPPPAPPPAPPRRRRKKVTVTETYTHWKG